jgi:hypothetical protein
MTNKESLIFLCALHFFLCLILFFGFVFSKITVKDVVLRNYSESDIDSLVLSYQKPEKREKLKQLILHANKMENTVINLHQTAERFVFFLLLYSLLTAGLSLYVFLTLNRQLSRGQH